ncbi:SEC-C domain-containing protein [Hymenobacter sp. M29]|uniref:SEC-C domain-containing protein n=1 Tax=Hymenobacter mellowenesis TaxID=3063995 RepID=A0ABT9A8W3_9BACT|nr:SEC-C domain-containing protein [Hymenobacter sp. M29]MDO7846281.1 SEC-C domain-containing protein [Hymenobacter sp. M29]
MADITGELEKFVAALKGILANSSTSEVTEMLYATRLRVAGTGKQMPPGLTGLESPARQRAFLLGLLLATEEPAEPRDFGFAEWSECVTLLNSAFGIYEGLFLPDQPGEQSEDWWRAREVAGPVFMHYFNTSLIANIEQIKERIRAYCTPFDTQLVQAIGISASDSLAIMDFIAQTMEGNMRTMMKLQSKLEGEQKRLFESGDFMRRDDPDYRNLLRKNYPIIYGYFSRYERQGQISRTDIEAVFPTQAGAFWERYAVSRGEGDTLNYPTEDSIFDFKPLIVLDDEYASCPVANNLFEAVLRTCEGALATGPDRRRVFTYRDNVLEREGEAQFRRLLGKDGQVFSTVFETPKAHKEHDLLLVAGNVVVVVEAKASPPVEPSRTPERAFERLRQSFRKDSGIQHAFEQAATIQRRLTAGEEVPLYSDKGELVITLKPEEHTECFCVCLTRDDFGHLATNLSLLLEKDPAEPYPWAVNIWDLEAMADAWSFLGWDFSKLTEYLRQRQEVQGRVLGSDELEFVGSFIHHGSLDSGLKRGLDFVQLNPNYSDFFDELYDHLKYGAPAPDHELIKPSVMDWRDSLKAGKPVFLNELGSKAAPKKPGRNDPCPCGSGVKYKKCHGR